MAHLPRLNDLKDAVTPTLRLGVTGLSRAGKTVLITSLVRNLVSGGRLPFFLVRAEDRLRGAFLEPQPDDHVPRFDYDAHVAALMGSPPRWPESTRIVSQIRVAIDYDSGLAWRKLLVPATGPGRLFVDIIDYPGEWLLDLALMEETYASWSAGALASARAPKRAAAARPFLELLATIDANAPQDEAKARALAERFTVYLRTTRQSEPASPTLGPGRFLLPGELEGSPLLTFAPLDLPGGTGPSRSLSDMMQRRFESYQSRVVEPFFRDHFARLDRQIVLIDVLSALNGGPEALAELKATLEACLKAFRPGASSWLSRIFSPRIDRIVFAASKADHLNHLSHDRLEAILAALVADAMDRAKIKGADVSVLALSALRATEEGTQRNQGEDLPVVVGIPQAGERIGAKVYDGKTKAAIFPGDLPSDPMTILGDPGARLDLSFPRFEPPRIPELSPTGEVAPWPHIRLDRALERLIGDRLR